MTEDLVPTHAALRAKEQIGKRIDLKKQFNPWQKFWWSALIIVCNKILISHVSMLDEADICFIHKIRFICHNIIYLILSPLRYCQNQLKGIIEYCILIKIKNISVSSRAAKPGFPQTCALTANPTCSPAGLPLQPVPLDGVFPLPTYLHGNLMGVKWIWWFYLLPNLVNIGQ